MHSVIKRRNTRDDNNYDAGRSFPIGQYILLTAIVVLAFGLRYWFNFIDSHPNNYGSCDASEYLRNAGALLNLPNMPAGFWHDAWACLTGSASPEQIVGIKTALAPLRGLYQSGPIFPLFLAASYTSVFTQFDMLNWSVPVFANCLISALTCLFIALTGSYAFNKQTGFLAGLIAAVYPAFIVNSGRLYSETFAAFLLSVILFMTVRNFGSNEGFLNAFGTSFINGATAAALQFTRSTMAVLSLILVPVTLFQQDIRKGVIGLTGLLLGFALIAAPWLVFQKLAFGSANLIVDRVGHYNFFIGNNVDTLGWLSFPYPDGRGVDEKPMPELAKESIARSPIRWLRLLQDKPLRLLKFPWNDFRTQLGPITFHMQVLFHQALILLAAIGTALSFSVSERQSADLGYERNLNPSRGNGAKLFILFVLLIHAIYLLFITVPRYNLTAMPEVIIFAAAGVTGLLSLMQKRDGFLPASTVVLSAILLFLLVRLPIVSLIASVAGGEKAGVGLAVDCCLKIMVLLALASSLWIGISRLSIGELGDTRRRPGKLISQLMVLILFVLSIPLVGLPANANGRWNEWQYKLMYPGQTLTQNIVVPAGWQKELSGRQLYLMVDHEGKAAMSNYEVLLNGKALPGPAVPSIALVDEFERFQTVKDGEFMREGEWVFDCLAQSADIRNSELRQWFLIPVPADAIGATQRLEVAVRQTGGTAGGQFFGSYPTSKTSLIIPNPFLYSWEKAFYGVENDRGFSDTRYDYKLTSFAVQSSNKDLSLVPGTQSGRFHIHFLAGPSTNVNDNIYTVLPHPPSYDLQTLYTTPAQQAIMHDDGKKITFALPELPIYDRKDLWLIRVSGQVRRDSGKGRLRLNIKAITNDKGKTYASPWANDVEFGRGWQRFDSAVPLQPGALPSPVNKALCEMQLTHATADEASSLKVDGVTELKNVILQVLRLPANPLHAGSVVY